MTFFIEGYETNMPSCGFILGRVEGSDGRPDPLLYKHCNREAVVTKVNAIKWWTYENRCVSHTEMPGDELYFAYTVPVGIAAELQLCIGALNMLYKEAQQKDEYTRSEQTVLHKAGKLLANKANETVKRKA